MNLTYDGKEITPDVNFVKHESLKSLMKKGIQDKDQLIVKVKSSDGQETSTDESNLKILQCNF